MIWCFQPCFDDTSITMGQIVSMETTKPYIGLRPLVGTGGKVLMQGQKSPVSCSDPTRIQPGQTESFNDEDEVDIIGVAVPPNIKGGQVIHVAHPDKSGRLIRVQVPLGLKPGDVFHVQAPSKAFDAQYSLSLGTSNTSGDYDESEATTQQYSSADYTDGTSTIEPVRPPRMREGPPVANSFEDGSLARKNVGPTDSRIFHSPALTRKKGIVKVDVPPGVCPGSTIHVQIPGSNRIVAATVPADCTEFHIEYEIFPSSTSKNVPDHDSRQPPAVSREPSTAQTKTKLLLVHVPPGTPAGSVLHVQVPNEHGRLIQAIVPPNTQAFHVSYKPRFITNERESAPLSSY